MRRMLGLTAWLGIMFAAGIAPAGVIDVPGDYAQIHDAVQACPAGDTVLVAAGTYHDCTHETEGPGSVLASVIMRTGVTLIGAGPDATIIDAEQLGRGIFMDHVANAWIGNLQVTNAYAEVYGAGILIRYVDATVQLQDLKIIDNGDGGIICINEAHPILRNIQFYGNIGKSGGGLAVEESSNAEAYDCYFEGNEAPAGGAIIFRNNSNGILSGCEVRANFTNSDYGNGGGLNVDSSSPTIEDCLFVANDSRGNGGGVAYTNYAAGTMTGCSIIDNLGSFSASMGGGISIESSTPTLTDVLIAGNGATGIWSEGGGVNIMFNSPVLTNCTIADNALGASSSGLAGGIAFQFGGNATIDKCIVASADLGAGLYCMGSTPVISCTDVWGNAGGDALCGTDAGGNFSLDPMFCYLPDVEYHVDEESPCAPGNHPDGCADDLIGGQPVGCTTGVDEMPILAARLLGNVPNPFNPATRIFFVLDEAGDARIRILDVAGRTVADLNLGHLDAGQHEAAWNGLDMNGMPVASGLYLYELDALGVKHAKRMTLIK